MIKARSLFYKVHGEQTHLLPLKKGKRKKRQAANSRRVYIVVDPKYLLSIGAFQFQKHLALNGFASWLTEFHSSFQKLAHATPKGFSGSGACMAAKSNPRTRRASRRNHSLRALVSAPGCAVIVGIKMRGQKQIQSSL